MYDKVINSLYSVLENLLNIKLNRWVEQCSGGEKNGWSFLISTDAKNKEMLKQCIKSIQDDLQEKCEYEIILIGNISKECLKLDNPKIKVIRYRDVNLPKARGWITKKKNIAVKASQYDKIVLLHDYIKIDEGWYEGYEKFGNDFDVSCNKIKLLDGRRANDWVCWESAKYGLTQCCLPYDIILAGDQYVPGNYIVCKRSFFLQHPLDERLKWGEGEDVVWSKEIQKYTTIKFNKYSSVSFLKAKAENWPPYCESWLNMSVKATTLFESTCGMDDIIQASKSGKRLRG